MPGLHHQDAIWLLCCQLRERASTPLKVLEDQGEAGPAPLLAACCLCVSGLQARPAPTACRGGCCCCCLGCLKWCWLLRWLLRWLLALAALALPLGLFALWLWGRWQVGWPATPLLPEFLQALRREGSLL